MQYRYWILRYLPDAVRGEFLNVGVVAGRDGADWAVRSIDSFDRASRIGGDLNVARSWISSIQEEVNRTTPDHLAFDEIGMSESHLARLRTLHNNSVQISEPLPVVANSAAEAVAILFERLVVEPVRRPRSTSYIQAVGSLQTAYGRFRGDLNLLPKVKVRSGRQQVDFDFALHGHRIEQLSRVWAFDVKDADPQVERIQAWGFRIEELRTHGGDLIQAGRTIHVDKKVPVKVLYVPPKTSSAQQSLEIAQDAWDRIDAEAFPVSEVESLVAA